ncbi:MAG: DUF1816 domain-containing protein [Leptolyngbya sp. SIO1E4]|nr:DUF1816 domain-containing protein [Leptolyngbya sp. SIO1E4]
MLNFPPVRSNGFAWWIEVRTTIPICAYYFGPFESERDAQSNQHPYVEDLVQEKAKGITVEIIRCEPKELTIAPEPYPTD